MPHPAAPGPGPPNMVGTMHGWCSGAAGIPCSSQKSGNFSPLQEGLKRARGARAAKNPSPHTQGSHGKLGELTPSHWPHQKHGEMDVKNNSCGYSEWDFGSLTNSSPAAGSGGLESLQQGHRAKKTQPQHGAVIPKPSRRLDPADP